MNYSKIIDISVPLHPETTVYPGNPEVVFEQEKGATSTHTKITLGSHAGTHIDAPSHVFENANGIIDLALEDFVGVCRVLDFTAVEDSVKTIHLEEKNIQEGERILLKTKNSEIGFESFRDDYIYLDGDAAEFLASKKISLIGIDYLSIKQRGSKDNRPHTALLEKNIPIIETINLKNVKEGEYILIALPLPYANIDGAQTRAVLLQQ